MEGIRNNQGGYNYRWSRPFNSGFEYRRNMSPNGSMVIGVNLSDYRGPFGTLNPRTGTYTPQDRIPYRYHASRNARPAYGQREFSNSERHHPQCGPLRGIPEFRQMNLRDMAYQRVPKREYGPYFNRNGR